MFPTVSLGPFTVYTYTLLINLGVVGSLAWLWWRAPAQGRAGARWLDAGLCAAAGALFGGRLTFVASNWAYFDRHLSEIIRLWEGGYTWPGVMLGGLLGLTVYCALRKEPLAPLLDALALPVLAITALGWAGCAAAACAAGKESFYPSALNPDTWPQLDALSKFRTLVDLVVYNIGVNWPDLYGVVLHRWPTQLIGLSLSLAAFGYLVAQRDRRWPRGFRFALAFTFVALISFLTSTVRGDDMPLVGRWRLDTAANAFMLGLGLIALVAAWALKPANQTLQNSTGEPAESAESN